MALRNIIFFITALLLSNSLLAADPKEGLLVQKYLNAFASRDAAGIYTLFNWEGVDRSTRTSVQKAIKSSFKGRQIRRIYIDPVAAGPIPSYEQEGKTYQLNLKPSGQMTIVYVTNKGKRTSTQLFVGEHKGELKIGSAVIAPDTLACKSKSGSPAAC